LTRVESQSVYHSFLPPAEEIERLEALLPGTFERLLALGEGEAHHRREIQRATLRVNGRNSTMGVLFAGVIGLIAVGGGVAGMSLGLVTDWTGAGVALGGLAALVGTFVVGRTRR
jgi:uncharacterized membrane protein